MITAAIAVVFVAAAPDLARAQPPVPIYLGEPLRDCVTGNNQFYSGSDGKFAWWVNQSPSLDRAARVAPGRCDSHQNDSYERPTDQTFRNNQITQKPAGAGPPFTYVSPAKPKSAVFLSGLAPDAELGPGQTAFSTEGGLYFEFLDITRGQSGYIAEGQTLRADAPQRAAAQRPLPGGVQSPDDGGGRRSDCPQGRAGHGPNDRRRRRSLTGQRGQESDIRAVPARGEAAPGRARAGDLPGQAADRERGRARTSVRPLTLGDGWMFFQIELFGEAEVTSDLERVLTRQIGRRSVRAFANGTYYTVRLGATRTRTGPTTGSPSATSSGAPFRPLRPGRRARAR